MTGLADRRLEMTLRNHVLFGVGEIARLPDVIAAAGGTRAFIVTDPGVHVAGLLARVTDALASVHATSFSQVSSSSRPM